MKVHAGEIVLLFGFVEIERHDLKALVVILGVELREILRFVVAVRAPGVGHDRQPDFALFKSGAGGSFKRVPAVKERTFESCAFTRDIEPESSAPNVNLPSDGSVCVDLARLAQSPDQAARRFPRLGDGGVRPPGDRYASSVQSSRPSRHAHVPSASVQIQGADRVYSPLGDSIENAPSKQ